MGTASEKQVEANRRNASKSTGPKTSDGKARSRRNGLKHGLAAEVLVPEEDRETYRAALKRWEHETGPSDVVERHLIRRAAVASVTLDRLDEAREQTREDSARAAVRAWEKRGRHAARRKAQDLEKDPFGVVADLECTAFGCDWMIRQWRALDGPLAVGAEWNKSQLDRAQRLMGYPVGRPGSDAEPPVRALWLMAGALAPLSIGTLPRTPDEVGYPTEPDNARFLLRRFVAAQVERLEGLRAEGWEDVEGPERRSVIIRAAAADTSKEGQLRHRYAKDADRSHNAAMRLFLCARGKRRQEYLAIAREARQSGKLPRVPAGGGWWHEVDCEPAPPGFRRIPIGAEEVGPGPMPIAPAPTVEVGPPSGSAPMAVDAPSPPIATETAPSTDPLPEAPGGPRRSEPVSPADGAKNTLSKSEHDNDLHDETPDRSVDDPGRTEPLPEAGPPPTTPPGPASGPGARPPEGGPSGPSPARTPITPIEPPDRPARPVGGPRRSEPISPADATRYPERNPNPNHELQLKSSADSVGEARRTGPSPAPVRPGRRRHPSRRRR